ncbi:hypothetical protein D3C77_736550 [compost metagenome]
MAHQLLEVVVKTACIALHTLVQQWQEGIAAVLGGLQVGGTGTQDPVELRIIPAQRKLKNVAHG